MFAHKFMIAIGLLVLSIPLDAIAQQPVQWRYSFDDEGVATATYPGKVVAENDMTINAQSTFWERWSSTLSNAYDKIPSPIIANLSYGYDASATGTAIGIQSNVDIYAEGLPAAGKNEFAAYYGYVRAQAAGSQPPGQNYWTTDFNIQTPYKTNAADRPFFAVGISQRMMNLSAGGNVIDATHAGMYGLSIVATPMSAAELASTGAPLSASTQPLTAMVSVAGYNGQSTVTNGTDAGALNAADYAIRIGNGGGSVYIPNTARSKFGVGIGVYDWTNAGIDVGNRLLGGSGPGIANIYETWLGSTQLTGSANALLINKNNGSNYTGIQMGASGTRWVMGTDSAASSGDNLFFYSSTSTGYPLRLTPTSVIVGAPVLLQSYTVATLPTCNIGMRGGMAYVTDAAAPSYNAALTGGGAIVVPAFCNGTNWTAH